MTKSGKHCGKRRNCTFCAISSFFTMFSKSCLLQRRQKACIWGKGLREMLADDFDSMFGKPWQIPLDEGILGIITWRKNSKHGRWKNCSFWAISPFVTMFSKVVCYRSVRKCLYVGKGLERLNNEWLRKYYSINYICFPTAFLRMLCVSV